jgi:hypothetical protein
VGGCGCLLLISRLQASSNVNLIALLRAISRCAVLRMRMRCTGRLSAPAGSNAHSHPACLRESFGGRYGTTGGGGTEHITACLKYAHSNHTDTCTHTCTRIRAYTHTHICAHIHTLTHSHTHTRTHTHTHTHTRTHAHKHKHTTFRPRTRPHMHVWTDGWMDA